MFGTKTFISACMVLFVVITGSQIAFTSSGNPPFGHAGVPGTNNCTSCHTGTLNSGIALRTLTFSGQANLTSYSPNQVYSLTVTISQPGSTKFGFQIAARTATNQSAGQFIPDQSFTGLNWDHLGHMMMSTNAFPLPGMRKWVFNWRAPVAGTGTVQLYLSTVAANGNGATSGDFSYTDVFTLTEGPAIPSLGSISHSGNSGFCAGSTMPITLQFMPAQFPPNNVFSVQLSDSLGNFNSPLTLSSTSLTGVNATVQLPNNLPTGRFYHIRLVSSNPVNYSSTNTYPITIGQPSSAPTIQWDGRTFTASTDSALTTWHTPSGPLNERGKTFTPLHVGNYAAGHDGWPCNPTLSAFSSVTALINLSQPNAHSGQVRCREDSLNIPYTITGTFPTTTSYAVEFINTRNQITTMPARIAFFRTLRTAPPALVFGDSLRYRIVTSNPVARSAWSSTMIQEAIPQTPVLRQEGMTLKTDGGGVLRWFINGTEIQGNTADSLVIAANGSYAAVRLGNNCHSDTSNAVIVTNVSVNELATSGIKFYPNPVHDILIIEASQKGNLELINGSGVSVLNQQIETGLHRIELHTFPPGIYVLAWRNEEGYKYSRIVRF